MGFSDARRAPRPRLVIATAVVLGLFAAVIGCWLVRSERAAFVLPDSVPTSLTTVAGDHDNADHGLPPTIHKVFKSAGMHRNRPPTWLHSVPSSWWSPSPVFLPASQYQLGTANVAAPATALTGRDLLTRFCIARR